MNGIFGEAKVYQVLALLNEILIHPMNKFELIDGMMTIETIKILMAKTHKIDSLFSHLPSHAYLK